MFGLRKRLPFRAALVLFPFSIACGQTTYLLQTLAGSDEVGDGGPATSALIAHVEGVAADPLGGFYFADADGHRVRHVSPSGVISTVAGTGRPGFSGDGGPAAKAQLNTPYGISADRQGNLYIADLGNGRVRRIGRDGTISTIAGGGSTAPSQADGRPAAEVALKSPRNIAADNAGNVYVSDFADHRIWQITSDGVLLRIAGSGAAGSSGDGGSALGATVNSPAGLALDSAGSLYVADSGNGRIRKIWRGIITTVGDPGRPGAPNAIPLGIPTGIAVDTDGSLFIADSGNSKVIRVSPLMQITTVAQPARDVSIDAAGTVYSCAGSYVYRRTRTGVTTIAAGSGTYAFAGDGGPAYRARFSRPSAVARDAAGALYVADTGNHRIRKIAPDGTVFTIAGTGIAGSAGDGGPAIAAQLNSPSALAVDRAGNILIADTGNHRIRKLDYAGNLTTLAGTGQRGFSGDGGLAVRARLDSPAGIALHPDGSIWISDTGNHVVRRISLDGSIATSAGTGNRGYAGDGGVPAAASFDSPRALAFDGDGNLFIADTGNHRLRRVSAGSAIGPGIINTFPANDAALWRQPAGLAVDGAGNVFLADALEQRVFKLEPAGRISAVAGDGWQGFNGEASAALSARLDTPIGLLTDPAGNVYFADSGNDRIRKLTPNVDLVPPPLADSPATIVNAASLLPGPVAPGEIVSLFGTGLAVEGGTTQVLFSGRPAALFFVQATQINLQVPNSLGDAATTEVQVLVNGITRVRISVGLADACPALFTMGGSGQVVAWNEEGTLNSPEHPASRGSVVTMFATGEGRLTPPLEDGKPAGFPGPAPVLPVSLKIGDYAAELLYAQAAPGFAGLMQINARVPGGFAPPGILPVSLQVGTVVSQPGVVLAVK